jgi:hypothetical protein
MQVSVVLKVVGDFRASVFLVAVLLTAPHLCRAQQADTLEIRGTSLDVDLYGNLYVLDQDRATLTILDGAGIRIATMGGVGWENDQFDKPDGLWARNGIDVFVADYGNHRIQRFDRTLHYISTLFTRDHDATEERFGYPMDVAVSRHGDLFVCDGENQRVLKFGIAGTVVQSIGGLVGGKGRLIAPTRIAIGQQDNLYVLDGRRVVLFDAFGNYLMDLAPGLFKAPSALWADEQGVLVADDGKVIAFDPDHRPAGSLQISPDVEKPRAIASWRGTLYITFEKCIIKTKDPRLATELLDK